MTNFFKVVQQGQVFSVPSSKNDSGQTLKCNLVLRELGSNYADQYIGALLGNAAECKFYSGDLVVATLRFSTRDHNGSTYQDILITDIVKIKSQLA